MHAFEKADDTTESVARRHPNPPDRSTDQSKIIALQRAAGNAAVSRVLGKDSGRSNIPLKVVQRQDDSELANAESVDDAVPAMGAPPIISEDLEFSSDDEAPAVQELADPHVQRQARPAPQPPPRPPEGCPAVTFANFPRLNPGGQFLANTAFRWSLRNRRFTVTFDRANSWVRPNAVNNRQLERHEQYHLRLACAIATIANDMLARGDNERAVADQLRRSLQIHTEQYDADTDHGTVAQQQSAFEQAIDAGQIQMAAP